MVVASCIYFTKSMASLNLPPPRGRDHHPHFAGEQTEAQTLHGRGGSQIMLLPSSCALLPACLNASPRGPLFGPTHLSLVLMTRETVPSSLPEWVICNLSLEKVF